MMTTRSSVMAGSTTMAAQFAMLHASPAACPVTLLQLPPDMYAGDASRPPAGNSRAFSDAGNRATSKRTPERTTSTVVLSIRSSTLSPKSTLQRAESESADGVQVYI